MVELQEKFFDEISKVKYNLAHKPMKVKDLIRLYDKKLLLFNTDYQRMEVWKLKKKRLLIDSILRKYDISMIFLRQIIKHDDLRYECIDGQQRLRCIIQFIRNQFDITPDVTPNLENKYFYDQLSPEIKSDIQSFEINSVIVSDADDDTTTDIFMRLQEGVTLNHAEKLNAEKSKMRKAAIEISQHPFFSSTLLPNFRFSYRYYAAQMLALSTDPESSDVGYAPLKRKYDAYKNSFPDSAMAKTIKSLTLLQRILGTRSHAIRSKSDILILHLITSKLLPTYSTHGFEEKIGRFIMDFISKVARASQSANENSKSPYVRYAYHKKYASLRIQEKYRIMASQLLLAIPDMKRKDPRRSFADPERLAIYVRANEKCANCERITSFNEGHADHIIRHTDGGFTTIKNGRWVCQSCHHNIIHGRKSS